MPLAALYEPNDTTNQYAPPFLHPFRVEMDVLCWRPSTVQCRQESIVDSRRKRFIRLALIDCHFKQTKVG